MKIRVSTEFDVRKVGRQHFVYNRDNKVIAKESTVAHCLDAVWNRFNNAEMPLDPLDICHGNSILPQVTKAEMRK